jgi:1,4-alpha-glucan branching enzyme
MAATQKKRVNFNLHAPGARSVHVAGNFNDWDPSARALKCDKKGVWRTWMNLPTGEYEYRFVVDEKWQEDPICEERARNAFGAYNSAFVV